MSRSCGHYKELFGAQARRLAARETLDLAPWAYKVYVSGTPAQAEKGVKP